MMVSVLAYSGLRPGEMLGLEVRHVRDRTLLVEQAVAHGRLKIQRTGRAYRTVDPFDVLRGDLRAWIEQVGESRTRCWKHLKRRCADTAASTAG